MGNILIDTDIAIEYLRSKDKGSTELVRLLRNHVIHVSAISEFELFLGARTKRHRDDLEMIFEQMGFVGFNFGCGRIASDIWTNRKATHQNLEIKDIFIASIAIHEDLWLRTFNEKHFKGIEKLKIWRW
jgi:tRNA(fMet)-specific endonuclease VapC